MSCVTIAVQSYATLFVHVSEWASIVGVGGVAVALVQLARTRGSVEAAQLAIERTEKNLALSQVLVLLPQLQKLEADVDAAVSADVREAVLRHLAEWRRLATELRGLIEKQPYSDDEGVALLQSSAVIAAATKSQLLDSKRDVVIGTKAAREEIAKACEYIGSLSGRLRAYSEPG
jgi:hypothetical protein